MADLTLPIASNSIYHICNRAVGNEALFENEKQYMHFLKCIEKYLLPKVNIWSYCLMPNHFHFLIEIKENITGETISKALSDCCNAYTKWLNILTNRKGNLFMRPFKRNRIKNEAHLAWTIWYIHRNPMHHHYTANFKDWKYSSYKAIISSGTKVAAKAVLEFFGGLQAYLQFHEMQNMGYYETLE
jgi:REP element-mobilizing transposase RayT